MKKVQLLSCLLLSIHFLYAQEDNKKNGTSLATTNTSFDSNIKSITDAFGICHAGKTKSKGEYDLLDDLGIDWIRIDFRWDKIEKQKGNFDFTQMDQLVDSAILHNKKILGVICYDTPWIHEENKRKFYISPENQKDYINYVIKLTEHYKWKVPAFEIWNEPNNRLRKFWNGPEQDFFSLLQKTTETIKKVNPEIIIAAPALFRNDYKYLKRMFEAGVLDLVDVISFHPYSASFNTYNRQIEKILKISNDYSHQKKYWITEIGYPTGGFYPWRSSLSKYPEKVVKTLIYGLSENIDKIFWYELFDGKKQRWYNSEDHFGLAKKGKEYDYKKGAYAFKAIAGNVANSLLVNSKVECNLPKVEYNYFIKNNGEGILVLWSERKYRSIGITIPGTNIRKISIESSNIDYLNDGTIHCSLGKKPLVLLFELKKEQNETIKIDTL